MNSKYIKMQFKKAQKLVQNTNFPVIMNSKSIKMQFSPQNYSTNAIFTTKLFQKLNQKCNSWNKKNSRT
jgi:hypothetical protein